MIVLIGIGVVLLVLTIGLLSYKIKRVYLFLLILLSMACLVVGFSVSGFGNGYNQGQIDVLKGKQDYEIQIVYHSTEEGIIGIDTLYVKHGR